MKNGSILRFMRIIRNGVIYSATKFIMWQFWLVPWFKRNMEQRIIALWSLWLCCVIEAEKLTSMSDVRTVCSEYFSECHFHFALNWVCAAEMSWGFTFLSPFDYLSCTNCCLSWNNSVWGNGHHGSIYSGTYETMAADNRHFVVDLDVWRASRCEEGTQPLV